jgi:putative transposase
MERKFNFSVDEFYHLYSRGVDKRVVFDDDNDRSRFIKLLFVCNHSESIVFRDLSRDSSLQDIFDFPADQSLVDIGAYCLMPNHFHLLVHEKKEGGVSIFMKKLLTAYSKYYNTKNKRKGALFDGNFKAQHLDDDNYLKYIYAYIHLNPVKLVYPKWREENGLFDVESAKNFIETYSYSSYGDYTGNNRKLGKILNRGAFPDYFEELNDFKEMLDFWLNYEEDED